MTDTAAAGDVPWTGVLTVLDTPSVGRVTIARPAAGTAPMRTLPMPLYFLTPTGVVRAVSIGTVERVEVEGNNLVGHGRINGTDPAAAPLIRALRAAGDAGLPCGVDLDYTETAEPDGGGLLITTWRVTDIAVWDDPPEAAFPVARIRIAA